MLIYLGQVDGGDDVNSYIDGINGHHDVWTRFYSGGLWESHEPATTYSGELSPIEWTQGVAFNTPEPRSIILLTVGLVILFLMKARTRGGSWR